LVRRRRECMSGPIGSVCSIAGKGRESEVGDFWRMTYFRDTKGSEACPE